jgi:hypothetical protein
MAKKPKRLTRAMVNSFLIVLFQSCQRRRPQKIIEWSGARKIRSPLKLLKEWRVLWMDKCICKFCWRACLQNLEDGGFGDQRIATLMGRKPSSRSEKWKEHATAACETSFTAMCETSFKIDFLASLKKRVWKSRRAWTIITKSRITQ